MTRGISNAKENSLLAQSDRFGRKDEAMRTIDNKQGSVKLNIGSVVYRAGIEELGEIQQVFKLVPLPEPQNACGEKPSTYSKSHLGDTRARVDDDVDLDRHY